MCFSYGADLTAAAVLTPVGIVTLRAAKTRAQLPIASIPLFFAAHQFVESFVWLGVGHHASKGVESFAIYLYLVMAQMLLPVIVPLAISAVEPVQRRRQWMYASAVGGFVSAAAFGYILVTQGATAHAADRTMIYKTPTDLGLWAGALYANATVLTTLYASGRNLRLFGVANILGISMASWMRWEAVTSVWCIYAAFVSGLILLHLNELNASRGTPPRGRVSDADTPPLPA
ncbi:MAG: DUF6629 family protein [Solirubrobacteraceae bacterium]|nr:hypothetical protein [Patulibacter sp.]